MLESAKSGPCWWRASRDGRMDTGHRGSFEISGNQWRLAFPRRSAQPVLAHPFGVRIATSLIQTFMSLNSSPG